MLRFAGGRFGWSRGTGSLARYSSATSLLRASRPPLSLSFGPGCRPGSPEWPCRAHDRQIGRLGTARRDRKRVSRQTRDAQARSRFECRTSYWLSSPGHLSGASLFSPCKNGCTIAHRVEVASASSIKTNRHSHRSVANVKRAAGERDRCSPSTGYTIRRCRRPAITFRS